MNPFWSNIYDDVKDRRYGTLFFMTFLVSLGLVLLIVWASDQLDPRDRNEFYLSVGIGLGVVLTAFIWRWVVVARRNHRERLKYSSLSRDELAKARSKLKNRMKIEPPKSQTRRARPNRVPRPDTNLKF
jgi:hypothetical protein